MKARELLNLGIPRQAMKAALSVCAAAAEVGYNRDEIRARLTALASSPDDFLVHPQFAPLAELLINAPAVPPATLVRGEPLRYSTWGRDIDASAHEQMRNACRLPVSVAAALMPDAHVGYGLPIGGVLATENAVIPYAVGVDIACRVKMTVFDLPAPAEADRAKLSSILERNTRFGVGGAWRGGDRPDAPVMDDNWNVGPVAATLRDLAWNQLGTSGSGNHFVEFGEFELLADAPAGFNVPRGTHLAVVSHSGSRGPGARIADHYSRLARALHPNLPKELSHLAWLPLDGAGAEYWAAMELMGKYASANHAVIHDRIARSVAAPVLLQIENHHNFAWRETHNGRDVIVHRKGATPAGLGVLGYIPGTMAAPGYLVMGRGNAASLHSASHGAGRKMSRTKARESIRWSQLKSLLAERGVHLLSAGLDESPHAYKDIDEVMAAQADLVTPIGKFRPRIVKMAPAGERPED